MVFGSNANKRMDSVALRIVENHWCGVQRILSRCQNTYVFCCSIGNTLFLTVLTSVKVLLDAAVPFFSSSGLHSVNPSQRFSNLSTISSPLCLREALPRRVLHQRSFDFYSCRNYFFYCALGILRDGYNYRSTVNLKKSLHS